MSGAGDAEEASLSVLERLLANAALRDEAGRLRAPEPPARKPSGVSQGEVVGGRGAPYLARVLPLLSPSLPQAK